MDLNEVRLHLKDELEPDPRERGKYVCPLCGSGSEAGAGHNGAFSIDHDGVHGKCFSCGFYGDIFDLEAAQTGKALPEATRAVVARYEFLHSTGSKPAEAPAAAPVTQSFTAYLKACHDTLKGSAGEAYLRRRGFTPETMERFNLGYDASARRITIPYDRKGSYYSTRAVEAGMEPHHGKPAGVKSIIFNSPALYQQDPCFIVEAPLCAISVMQEGGSAIALSGLGENMLLSMLDNRRPSAMLILSLDNDPPKEDGKLGPGPEAQQKLAAALAERGIPFIELNVAGDCKDPNELLQKNPEQLRASIASAVTVAKMTQAAAAEQELVDYESQTTAAAFDNFLSFLDETGGNPPVPTGFSSLDRTLNGGLSAGLYIMGAISSLGKTSWMLNIADNIAEAGRDVLYFSLEMSRNELIAKSISRLSFRVIGENSGTTGDAFTTFEVINSRGKVSLSPGQLAVLKESARRYREGPGRRMWIFEGVGDFGVNEISQRVSDHIRITGRRPVVFVDYLQILAPADPRSTDKQNTDTAVRELKRLSRDCDVPVFSISSLNRLNYSEPITMSAFKESGAIEYGSDVLIGIQLYGVGYQPGEKTNAHTARVRELVEKAERDPQIDIEIKVLKNRNGGRGGSGRLLFDKKYNFFSEVPDGFTYSDTPTPFDDDENSDNDGWKTL